VTSNIADRPIPAEVYAGVADYTPPAGCAVLSGFSGEERSRIPAHWQAQSDNVLFVNVSTTRDTVTLEMPGGPSTIGLRDRTGMQRELLGLDRPVVVADITGMSHQVWAALLRVAPELPVSMHFVYIEPEDYRTLPEFGIGELFDLSDKIEGIGSLPGFAVLREVPEDRVCLIALLGFEGARFAHVLDELQPPGDKIVPVVGVPGFRLEYPFHTLMGNRHPLEKSRAWHRLRYAAAHDPFALFYLIEEIAVEYPAHLLKIATIGTKPHAVGAVLQALVRDNVQLIYDFPIRKADRSKGTARLHVYHVSEFLREYVSPL
jgi:hypothetical protein